jgi:hypothetical protein
MLPRYNFTRSDDDDNQSCGVFEEQQPVAPQQHRASSSLTAVIQQQQPHAAPLPPADYPLALTDDDLCGGGPAAVSSTARHHHHHLPAMADEDTSNFMLPDKLQDNINIKYIPYKYIVNDKKLIICTRPTDGSKFKFFAHRVNNWSYINIPHGIHNIPKTIQYLRSNLATDKVSFDKRTGTFVIEPSSAVTEKIVSVSLKPITKVPLTSSTILARLDKRFFDPFNLNGEISSTPLDSPLTMQKPAKYSNMICSGNINFAAFKTIVWTTVDESTIVFIYYNSSHDNYYKFSHSKVNIWTTFDKFNERESINTAIASIREKAVLISNGSPKRGGSTVVGEDDEEAAGAGGPGTRHHRQYEIDISVKSFGNVSNMLSDFITLIDDYTDICVHYGENLECNLLGNRIMKTYAAKVLKKEIDKVEFINLKHYITKIYSYLPSHEVYDIIKYIDLTENGTDVRVSACIKSILDGSQFIGWTLPITSEISTTENISFYIEKITAKCFVISKLYIVLSKSIFNISHLSGCNLSDITKPGYAARGIVATLNQIASCEQIVDKLPEDYIPPGFYSLTNVIPLAGILIDKMLTSAHELTREVGNVVKDIKDHGWIIRDLYSLRSLKPLKISENNLPGVFGYFNDMIYTTSVIPNFVPVCQWSSIINVGLGWIGITVPAAAAATASSSSGGGGDAADISFGYFGLDDVCNHPFQALRDAVEMYLTLFISSSANRAVASIPSPAMIAKTITLTNTNMKIRQSITSYNIDSYRNLILPRITSEIENGNMEIYIDLWHCKDENTFTTNQHKAEKSVYKKIITDTLHRSFDHILQKIVDIQSKHLLVHHHSSGGNGLPTDQQQHFRSVVVAPTSSPSGGGAGPTPMITSSKDLPQGVAAASAVALGGGQSSPPSPPPTPSPGTPIVETYIKGRDNIFKNHHHHI